MPQATVSSDKVYIVTSDVTGIDSVWSNNDAAFRRADALFTKEAEQRNVGDINVRVIVRKVRTSL